MISRIPSGEKHVSAVSTRALVSVDYSQMAHSEQKDARDSCRAGAFWEALQWLEALPKRQDLASMLEAFRTFFPVQQAALYCQRADGSTWRLETFSRKGEPSNAAIPSELLPVSEPGKSVLPQVLSAPSSVTALSESSLRQILGEPAGNQGGAISYELLPERKAIAIFSWTELPREPEAVMEQAKIFFWMGGYRMAAGQERSNLQGEQRFLQVLMNHSPDFVYSKDLDGVFTRCNAAFAQFLGVQDPREVVGKKDREFLVGAEQKESEMPPGEGRGLPGAAARRACFLRQNGTAVWVSMTEAPEYDESGMLIGSVGIARDITQRRLSEEALEQRRALLEATLGSVVEGVITFNEEGRVLLMNPVAEQMTGLSTAKVYGRHAADWLILSYDREGRDRLYPLRDVLEEGGRMETLRPVFLRDAHGDQKMVLVRAAPMHARDQVLFGAVLAMLDVTRQQAMEEEARRAEKLESLGLLAGGIAHDFNNLLTAMMGNITLASMESGANTNQTESLESAQRACQRAQALSSQLLTFAKGGEPNKQVRPLVPILKESVAIALEGSRIEVAFDLPDQLPEVEVDDCQIRQTFENLALNAAQAMQNQGHLKIRVQSNRPPAHLTTLDPANHHLAIEFVDKGTGISAEEQKKIFDPYYTTKRRGTGLGLTICRSVIERHGGVVTLQSEPGKGSCFTIWLPALSSFSSTQTAPKPMPNPSDPPTSPELSSAKPACRLLLFDDEEAILDFAKRCCQMMGHTVETVSDSDTAIKLVKEGRENGSPYHLAILDLSVPGDLSGDELLPLLREIDPGIKAVVSSGYSDDPVVAEYAEKGFDACLIKPYRVNQLREVIAEALSVRR